MSGSRDVHIHVGLPKTGTTYLQRLLARSRNLLADSGVLYPGPGPDHFFAAQDLLGRPFKGRDDDRTTKAWTRLCDQVAAWPGPVVLSHELLATARDNTVQRVLDDIGESRVRVIVTAREFAKQVLAGWQEDVKNGGTEAFPDFLARIERTSRLSDRAERPFWRLQDLSVVLDSWAQRLPRDRITVVTVPAAGASPGELWRRFAQAAELHHVPVDSSLGARNSSLGSAETEVLRRLNVWAGSSLDWPVYRRLVKKQLAEQVLVEQTMTPRLQLPPASLDWADTVSVEMADAVARGGYPVVGSLADLVPVRGPIDRTTPDWPPPDSELLGAAEAALRGTLARLADGIQGHGPG